MSRKQTTLFQAWGVDPGPSTSQQQRNEGTCEVLGEEGEEFGFSDDNDLTEAELLQVCEVDDLPTSNTKPGPSSSNQHLQQTTLPFHVGPSAALHSILNCSVVEDNVPGFDEEAGKIWIYPTNYPFREYQFNIAKKALFVNTLVCLPTGLGKTFIAAVVMYNFYRWFPSGRTVFLAPTKPLVAQQIEACYKVMGIPQEHIAEMTGR